MNKMSGSICILGLGLHSVLPCLEDLPDVAKLSVSGKVLEGSEDRLAIDVLPYTAVTSPAPATVGWGPLI